VAASAQTDAAADEAAEGAGAADKKATARRVHFRAGLTDKRLKPVGGLGLGDDEAPAASAAGGEEGEEAAAAAEGGAAADGEAATAEAAQPAGSEEERKLLAELEKALAEKRPPGLPDDPRLRRRA
jgi:hypothetical protein